MALESATYISGLVAANPPGTDAISQGDDHIRLIKSVLKSTLPNADEAINGVHTGTSEPSPNTAGQLWFDTSGDGILKIRNKGDSAFELLGGKVLGISVSSRAGYTDIRDTSFADAGLSCAHTKTDANSDLYVYVYTMVKPWSSFAGSADQTGWVQLVYATSTTTGITPLGARDAGYIKEAGLETGATAQIGFGFSSVFKVTGLAAAAYTFKIQGKCTSSSDGGIEFVDGTMQVMEVAA